MLISRHTHTYFPQKQKQEQGQGQGQEQEQEQEQEHEEEQRHLENILSYGQWPLSTSLPPSSSSSTAAGTGSSSSSNSTGYDSPPAKQRKSTPPRSTPAIPSATAVPKSPPMFDMYSPPVSPSPAARATYGTSDHGHGHDTENVVGNYSPPFSPGARVIRSSQNSIFAALPPIVTTARAGGVGGAGGTGGAEDRDRTISPHQQVCPGVECDIGYLLAIFLLCAETENVQT